MIDQGKKLFDGTLEGFRERYGSGVSLKLEFEDGAPNWKENGMYSLLEATDQQWVIKIPEEVSVKEAMIHLIQAFNPTNLHVQEERIEEVVRRAYVNQ